MLLNQTLGVVTTSFGLIKANSEQAACAFREWQNQILANYGFSLQHSEINGDLDSILKKLFPLTSPILTRYLFVPTLSEWTMYFDNGWQGSDAASVMSVLSKLMQTQSMRITCAPHTMPKKIKYESNGQFGANILEVYDANGDVGRSIFAANDGGKWRFGQSGAAYDFEDVESYSRRNIKDRFTENMLLNYLEQMGVRLRDDSFLLPKNSYAIFLEKQGPMPANLQEYGL